MHDAHLKTQHEKEEKALQQASHWAKRNAHTPSQTKVSSHGFWGKAEKAKSSHSMLSAKGNTNETLPSYLSRTGATEQESIWELLGANSAIQELTKGKSSSVGFFGKYNINYEPLLVGRDKASSNPKVASNSYYYSTPGSPLAGDASRELKIRSIDAIITAAKKANLNLRETAYALAIVRHESYFNPYAATTSTSAAGLGQFIDDTWKGSGFSMSERWNINAQAEAMIKLFKENRQRVWNRDLSDVYIYKYHHDGPKRDYGGLKLSKESVYPKIEEISELIKNAY